MISETIHDKKQIIVALKDTFDQVHQKVEMNSDTIFYQSLTEKWSMAENMDHLIRSCRPVASALKMPKLALRALGKPNGTPRTFEEIVDYYQGKLATGTAVAAGKYLPENSKAYPKADMLRDWQMVYGKFEERINKWKEADLDAYVLPHPLLGNLTIREMLFFTVYHNLHHLKAMDKLSS